MNMVETSTLWPLVGLRLVVPRSGGSRLEVGAHVVVGRSFAPLGARQVAVPVSTAQGMPQA